ncbi:zinc finger protein 436-like [Hemicordylus capensis]|uniref:zinc finger protein 436-like n=1 Tax=Hemicordylus capensis TaxID=884348 RepID=UPI0023030A54|nr:zinc finger protein 436-like [Hemicordylus capensis]
MPGIEAGKLYWQCWCCTISPPQEQKFRSEGVENKDAGDGMMKDTKGKTLQEEEEDFEPQVELHFTILEESEGGISQGKLWHCDIDAELQPESSSPPEPDDESVYSDRSRSPSPDLQEVLPAPDRKVGERRVETYPQQGPEQQVELHFTILEESEGGISEGKLCASEISPDEPQEMAYPESQWDGPVNWGKKPGQPSDVEKVSPPAEDRLEGEMKGEASQPESSDQQVELHFTIFDDSEEVSLSQGPEDYPIWESPFKPEMYQGDYPKEDWDASIDSLGDVFEASFQQQFYSGGRMYPCTECGRVFNRKSTLTRHWRTHTGEKPYSCLYCGRSFSLNLNLLTHQMTHTGEKPYKCPDCGQSFTRSTSVTRHQRSHREESPYPNDLWEESFSYGFPVPFPYPMPQMEEKSYMCPDCGETFTHSGSLNRHLRMHRGERPYKCVVCGEGFCSMSKLYRHERIHMVDKPYHCETCGKSFAVKSTLTRHQMLHQAERPYMCSHCEKGYVQRSHLARHHHKAHPGVPFNPVKANSMPATILDSDNLVTYFWGDEETDTTSEPVPTQLIYSGADC